MDGAITITYSVSPKDAARAHRSFVTRFHSQRNKSNYRNSLILMLLIAVLLFLTYISSGDASRNIFLGLAIILILILGLFNLAVLVVLPAVLGNRAKKFAEAEGAITLLVDEARIVQKGKTFEASTDWSLFGQIYETPDYFLLVTRQAKGSYEVIPIRAFTREQSTTFRSIASHKTQPITNIL